MVGDNDWAHLSGLHHRLLNWEAQNENPNILGLSRDFDTSHNLVTANTIDVRRVLRGRSRHDAGHGHRWTTGISNYIRIYTPYLASRGRDQPAALRHLEHDDRVPTRSGPAGANIGLASAYKTNYVRVDGLQIWLTDDDTYTAAST